MLTFTSWHKVPAWVLANETFSVTILPSKGGKICSIQDKRNQREWMAGPASRPVNPVAYGADYIQQEMCGWDEMFPTIDACQITSNGPLQGINLPDHGEIWTQECSINEKEDNAIKLSAEGIAFRYRLSRKATLIQNKLQLDYEVTNYREQPFPYLWTAHPQFQALEDTEILLPATVSSVYNVVNMPQWGIHGAIYSWPNAIRLDGQLQALNRVRSADFHECHKFYTLPDSEVNWAELRDISSGARLRMEWEPPVRYLGILVDEGKFNPESIIALEPSTGFYDDLDRAEKNGRASTLNPGETHNWQIRILIN